METAPAPRKADPPDSTGRERTRGGASGLLRPALVLTLTLALLTGGVFPLVTTGLAQLLFAPQANGGLVTRDGAVVGADLIGQAFTTPSYFHPRPSNTTATGGTDAAPYNAAQSSGGNAGPRNPALASAIATRTADYRAANRVDAGMRLPVDAVTGSGSGLDPHISPDNARLQAARVAGARNVPLPQVLETVSQQTEGRQLGILGEPRVNVLRLNRALDARFGPPR